MTNEQLLMIFVACTGAAVLLQAFVLLAMLFTARKALKVAQEQIEELRTTVLPLVKDTKQLLTNVGPKIESVATDMAALTSGLRAHYIPSLDEHGNLRVHDCAVPYWPASSALEVQNFPGSVLRVPVETPPDQEIPAKDPFNGTH